MKLLHNIYIYISNQQKREEVCLFKYASSTSRNGGKNLEWEKK